MRTRKEMDANIRQKVRQLHEMRKRSDLLEHLIALVRLAKQALAE